MQTHHATSPTTPAVNPATTRRHAAQLELDDLLALEPFALERLYAEARVPALNALQGDLRGRMLAVTMVPPGWSADRRRTWQ